MPRSILFLSKNILNQLPLTTQDIVESIEHLLLEKNCSQVWNAPKSVITPPDGRYMMATLSAANDPQILAVKTLLLNPKNSHRGLQSIYALVTLLDSDTGVPLAVLDGAWVTAERTAGLSAVAAKRLAKADSSIAAFIGCGVQAHSHLKIFTDLFPLTEIRAFGRGAENRNKLCQYAKELGLRATKCVTAQDAISNADIIVTSVTISPELQPFIDAGWLKPGAFVTMTDLAAPWYVESLSVFDRIVIDDLEQEASMSKPLVPPKLVSGDLTGLVNGKIAGRTRVETRTAFIFRGLALGDLAVSALAYQCAYDNSMGQPVEL
ncbi:ornithine cyclodeaminase family protein [Nitrosomonas sp.]|uniref:ornithine cyclodeaminase family protein n=1 Tax=Nitrosomonas sp. TaxID=42353 RepID=UPI00283F0470|nr:ornithine cyclodeaminase family protein [Nitrosomonas sp.]MDR4513107.1 ornithine cyclodeaminase family protein [Nitrosomonas sp.]